MVAAAPVEVYLTSVHDEIAAATKPVVVAVGGAGSSKSHSIAQLFVHLLINSDDKVLGVARKTMPALRRTAMQLIIDLLEDQGLYSKVAHNQTNHTMRYGKNRLQFFSLDEPDKIKSFNANFMWLEEANEFTWKDYGIIDLRLNRPAAGGINRMYVSLNPVDENCWIKTKLCDDNPDVEVIHSTYRDNPFLDAPYRAKLEGLINLDPNYHRIYARGEWGKLENIIYPEWVLVDGMPYDAEIERYGLDFGYEHPTVLVHIMVTGHNLYIDEAVYQNHITNSDLIGLMAPLPRWPIYADSAEPQRIEEISRAGFECYGAVKSVTVGIDQVNRLKIHITKRSVGIIKEIRGYARRQDKDGHIMEDPIKFNDDGMDALRYAVMGRDKPQAEGVAYYDTMDTLEGMNIDLV